jgi:hypothetical protein
MDDLTKAPVGAVRFNRCAFYGRYSTKMQRPASIEDQLRSCREFADKTGWELLDEHVYKDAAISGESKHNRRALKALEQAAGARPRPFDFSLMTLRDWDVIRAMCITS